jgi:hypothetical protein
MSVPFADSITVARAPKLWLAKRIWPDRTEPYSRAKHVDVSTVPLAGLDDIAALLACLVADPRAAVLRGELLEPAHCRGVRRLLYTDRKTGEAPTFRDVPRLWAALDIEGIARPDGIEAADLAGCAAVAIARLPAPFSAARCIAQATASHGIKPDIRLRLWFWLSRPTSGAELKRWLADTPADPAAFGAVQPIYTGAPRFMAGLVDHLPSRLAELPGAEFVEVPSAEALAPPPEPPRPPPGLRAPVPEAMLERFVDRVLARVRAAPEGQRHVTLRGAAVSLGGIQDRAGFADAEARSWLLDALGVPGSRHKDEDTIAWGLANGRGRPIDFEPPRSRAAPREPSRTAAGSTEQARRGVATSLPAYYPAPAEAREPALARQAGLIRETIAESVRLAAAREEAWGRRNAEIAAMGMDGLDLKPAKKAAITRRHNRAVAEEGGYGRRLPLPGRLLLTGSQGTGKTQEAYQAVAEIRTPMTVWITEPTIEKAEEVAGDYRLVAKPDSLPAMVVLGRGQSDPERPGHRMCDRHETAEQVAQAGLSVPGVLCARCPFSGECGSVRQSQEIEEMPRGAVFFLATAQLFVHSPAPLPDLLIADDLVALSAVEVLKIPYTALDPFGIPHVPEFVRERIDTLRSALLLSNPLKLLRREGFTREVLQVMSTALDSAVDKVTPPIDGEMTDDAIAAELDNAQTRKALRSALAVVGAVRREIDMPRDVFNAVYGRVEAPAEGTDRTQRPTITVSRFHRPHGIKRAGVLVLDGTGDADLDRKLFGDRLHHERVTMDRMAHIVGSVGRSYSRVSITGNDSAGLAIASRSAGAARQRNEIETIRGSLPGYAALFSTKGAIDALQNSGAVPDDAPVGHFAKVRGLNTWEHCRSALVMGAQSITIGELEDAARAFMGDDPVLFVSMDHPNPPGWRRGQWPYVATRMRRMRDGALSPATVEVHPDPRCQRVFEQIREAEAVQAGDRPRPVFNQRHLVFLNNLVLDVTYDEIRTHRELVAGGNRIELTARQFGMLPLGARGLHRLDPAEYPTLKAAEHALAKYPPNLKSLTFCDWGEFSYRVAGQPGLASRALIDPTRHPDPLAALRRFFGIIAEFQGVKLADVWPGQGEPGQRSDPMGHVPAVPGSWTVAEPHARPLAHAPPHD